MAIVGYTAIVPVQMGQGNIAATPGSTLYTAPSGVSGILKAFDVCNTTAAAVTVSVYLVPVGGTIATANALLYNVSVAPGTTFTWRGTQVLPSGMSIQAVGSVAGCTFTGSGAQYSSI